MKLPVDGGVPTPLCDSGQFFGASWGADNQIVFARPEESGLSRISADGGKPEVLTQPKRSNEESGHRLPFCLPAGKGILFTITSLVREERPLIFFTAIFILLSGFSVFLGIPVVMEFLQTGLVPRLPTAVLATGLMVLAFLSLASGLILDTVTRGRWELKRLAYLAIPGPQNLKSP